MTNSSNILDQLESGFANVNAIRSNMIQAKKVQLHPNIEGFDSPLSYGIYRHTGGAPLGTVGKDFQPMDLNLFVDTIEQSVSQCGNGLDLSKLSYKEYKGGAKVVFDLPLKSFKIDSPMKGDVLDTKLQFKTGFDGLTKVSLGFFALRLWCSNGAKSWQQDIGLSYKNTANNHAKTLLYCDEIFKTIAATEQYVNQLNGLAKRKVSKAEIDKFLTDLTGYNVAEYKDLTTRKRNILDKINQSIAIEMDNTGANQFSLLQGITRYTTHELAEGNEEILLFNEAAKMSDTAHKLLILN